MIETMQTSAIVVPAKAGTHTHRPLDCGKRHGLWSWVSGLAAAPLARDDTVHLICIPPARVREFWPHARALIEAAMEKGDISPFACVEHAVLTGGALLWLAWDADARAIAAACVTELQIVGARKLCLIVACGGHGMRQWLPLLAPIENYARAEGCAAMRIMGRAGWARVLKGYRVKRVILEKRLTQ